MEEGICEFTSSPKEIEYSSEDKIKYDFSIFFCVHVLFDSYFVWFNIFFIFVFFFPIFTMHLTFSFTFVDFLIKLSFFMKIGNSKKQLYYVITWRILWKWMQKYHLLWHGTLVGLLLILLAMLCLLVLWTSLGVIGCWVMH